VSTEAERVHKSIDSWPKSGFGGQLFHTRLDSSWITHRIDGSSTDADDNS
jgi:hypothetical protein